MTNAPKCWQDLNGRTDKRTDEQTNGRTVRFYYAPNLKWGIKNVTIVVMFNVKMQERNINQNNHEMFLTTYMRNN